MITAESQGAVDVLTPEGPLNHESREPLADAIEAIAPGAVPMVVVCLSETPLIDSAGLEALLDARDAVRQRGGALKLAAPAPLVGDALHATGVGDCFEQFDNIRSAVGSFSR